MSPSRTNGGARPIITVLHDGLLPDRVQELDTSYEVRHATADTFGDAVDGAQAVLLWDFFSSALRDQWSRCSALEWVHVAAAGVDKLLFDDLAASDVVVTNARGVFDVPIAEFVLASVLALAKDVRGTVELGRQARWLRRETENIAGRRALVIGTGSIGRATARMLRAVGMDVSGVGRSARAGDADFGTVHASADLASVVPGADYLVLIAPLTPSTRGMVGRDVLAAADPGVRVINVGRGELLDTDALVDALRGGHVGGAALDVFDTEPLPPEHVLWTLDHVLLTAHMSGDTVGWRDRLYSGFAENAELFAAGRPLRNVVDKSLGFVAG
ncbi:D-2-hydroxyacid dehydrogenase [Rhodococcus sp. SORGH_AS_0303]|uniref:D-2-hydroxyacid dehydrogenase n=1 Tax=Rhodococcus sp. SORGH_AS_0303 TaxID=3041753 RepID=UPI00277E1EFA|nr:D-2-hydroxyacid dehydrogenase [Rhodococcus sp. SORGH_AS_0303]MDQ1200981.1 phosphoglycerate dehydrogenase-like enzyme [Rhodococcus sp. SORGH_AS_0303]